MVRARNIANCIGWMAFGLLSTIGTCKAAPDVVVIVSASNATTTLSKNQIVDIFLGKANRFPDGSKVVPIDQAEGSAERDEFYLKASGKSAPQLKAYWSKIIFTGRGQPPRDVANGVEVKKLIAENPNAIGYMDRSLADASVKVLGEP